MTQTPQAQADEPPRSPTGSDDLLDSFLANYAAVQYQIVQYLSEHLVDCARAMDGDLDQVLILAILGQRQIDLLQGKGDGSMTSSRLSDVSGLPRETIRRKLSRMAERGWVVQVKGSGWNIAVDADGRSRVGRELADLDIRGLRRMARLVRALRPYDPTDQKPDP